MDGHRMKNRTRWQRYEMQAQVITALAHPMRVAIADLLKDGEVCVCEIAERIGAERSNTSRHLAIMLKAGVVKTRKDGLQVFYSLRTPCVLNLLSCATNAIQQTLKEQTKALAAS
jgi:DNA-binding transcriptional ArsR family regulator